MTTAPSDLLSFRQRGMDISGVTGNAFGIAPDPSHLAGGGYHVGVQDIKKIGRWTGSNIDYSVKLGRDRSVDGTNFSSAADWGGPWPRGGISAWLRFNNSLVAAKRANRPVLAPLRAINFTPDGSARKRYDSEHPGDGIINSNDTVTTHTHLEWYRDTINQREPCFQYILALADAAVRGMTLEDNMSGEADACFSKPYSGTEPWINGQSWMAKAVEHPIADTKAMVSQLIAASGKPVQITLTNAQLQQLADLIAAHPQTPGTEDDATAIKAALEEIIPQIKLGLATGNS